MAEHIILFAGPMGAGKTTAIRCLSEIEVVSTEAVNTDPYGAAWMIKLKMKNTGDADAMLSAAEYEEYLESNA